MQLSATQIEQYDRDGFLIFPGLFTPAEVAAMKRDLQRVQGIDTAAAVPGIEEVRITAKTDQLLEPLPEGASYLGFIFARGPDPGSVVGALRDAQARLRFEIAAPIALVTG